MLYWIVSDAPLGDVSFTDDVTVSVHAAPHTPPAHASPDAHAVVGPHWPHGSQVRVPALGPPSSPLASSAPASSRSTHCCEPGTHTIAKEHEGPSDAASAPPLDPELPLLVPDPLDPLDPEPLPASEPPPLLDPELPLAPEPSAVMAPPPSSAAERSCRFPVLSTASQPASTKAASGPTARIVRVFMARFSIVARLPREGNPFSGSGAAGPFDNQ
jgi:hypothetical protein